MTDELSSEDLHEWRRRNNTGKGPAQGSDTHTFCPICHRVMYSIWRYGPVSPAKYNRVYCVCDGIMTGEVKQKIVMYGIEDVPGGKEYLKEQAALAKAENKKKKGNG